MFLQSTLLFLFVVPKQTYDTVMREKEKKKTKRLADGFLCSKCLLCVYLRYLIE